jgi:hypothetical protein
MSKSEATTAITPAIGAIQKTTGLTDNDAKACKGMNIFEKRVHIPYIFFQKNLAVTHQKHEF